VRFAEMLDPERISPDNYLDLVMGTAGAALAMLAWYRKTNLAESLDKAVLCGEHVLKHRSERPQGPRAWKTVGGRMFTGFSHGSAGISLALLKLYQVTGHSAFREAAVGPSLRE
jgi:lantibiotic modifying enzyme